MHVYRINFSIRSQYKWRNSEKIIWLKAFRLGEHYFGNIGKKKKNSRKSATHFLPTLVIFKRPFLEFRHDHPTSFLSHITEFPLPRAHIHTLARKTYNPHTPLEKKVNRKNTLLTHDGFPRFPRARATEARPSAVFDEDK